MKIFCQTKALEVFVIVKPKSISEQKLLHMALIRLTAEFFCIHVHRYVVILIFKLV